MSTLLEQNKAEISISNTNNGLIIVIETPTLCLRTYKETDFEHCCKLYGDPKLTKYFDFGKPYSKEEVKNLVFERGIQYSSNQLPYGLFSAFEKKTGAFIGQIDLLPTSTPEVFEIGFILFREYHGFGYAQELLSAFLESFPNTINRLFDHKKINIKQIIATSHPRNTPSQMLKKRLGFCFLKKIQRFNSDRYLYLLEINTND